jgi:hypothetical protein
MIWDKLVIFVSELQFSQVFSPIPILATRMRQTSPLS